MQRRNFLKTSASAAVLAGTMPACAKPNPTGEPVIAHQGRTADYQPFSVIEPGLKIKKIETWSRPSVAVVRVTADNGMEGWGQISTYDADISATVLHRKIASHVGRRFIGLLVALRGFGRRRLEALESAVHHLDAQPFDLRAGFRRERSGDQ